MHLIEVLMAGTVFTIASGSSLQIWSATAMRAQQLTRREQLELAIEQDRVGLQTLWRNSLQTQSQTDVPTEASGCSATASQLVGLATDQPVQPGLRRDIQLSPDGRMARILWRSMDDLTVHRHRLVSPAGLGLCVLPAATPEQTTPLSPDPTGDTPITDSAVEGVPG